MLIYSFYQHICSIKYNLIREFFYYSNFSGFCSGVPKLFWQQSFVVDTWTIISAENICMKFLFPIIFIHVQNSRINNSTILVYASARAWLSWSSCSYSRSNSSLRRNWRRYSVVSYQSRGSRSLESKKYVLSLGNRRCLQTNRKWDRKDWAKCWEACLYSPLFHSSATSTAGDSWSNISKQSKRSYQ